MDDETLYQISSSVPAEKAKKVRYAMTDSLKPTTSTERKKKVEEKKRKASMTKTIRKSSAKIALGGLENLDTIFGAFERVCLLVFAELLRRGDWLNSCIFGVGVIIAWIIKVRMGDGPLVKIIKSDPSKIKQKLVDATRTLYSD